MRALWELSAGPVRSFREELSTIFKSLDLKIIAFYGMAVVASAALSLILSYETQVQSSIAAGILVAFLLVASLILSQGFALIDVFFIGGIVFLLLALFKRSLLPPTILQGFGHYALIVSLVLTGSYVLLRVRHGSRIGSHATSVKSFGDFFSISWTTLSSELCYCMHPMPLLEAFGIMALIPGQVRLGFVIMATTLLHQVRLTYESYGSRRKQAETRVLSSSPSTRAGTQIG